MTKYEIWLLEYVLTMGLNGEYWLALVLFVLGACFQST
jgi:hypothetical protein